MAYNPPQPISITSADGVNSYNSSIRAVNGTYVAGTGRRLTAFSLPSRTGRFENLTDFNYEILPNENIAFVTTGEASTATEVYTSWVEDF